jgi:hypothetical protein
MSERLRVMMQRDRASAMLGMRVVVDEPGHAVVTMPVREDMTNGFALTHGGFVFAVASVPSRSRPLLVDSLARGIAEVGRMPYLGALTPVNGGPAGRPGGNSAFRLAGVWDRFTTDGLDVPEGGVLLVDDQADSRWTLTVAARTLRQRGATAVLPFVLALRG